MMLDKKIFHKKKEALSKFEVRDQVESACVQIEKEQLQEIFEQRKELYCKEIQRVVYEYCDTIDHWLYRPFLHNNEYITYPRGCRPEYFFLLVTAIPPKEVKEAFRLDVTVCLLPPDPMEGKCLYMVRIKDKNVSLFWDIPEQEICLKEFMEDFHLENPFIESYRSGELVKICEQTRKHILDAIGEKAKTSAKNGILF